MSSISGKIKAPFQQAHQTPSDRAKITLIPLAVVAIAIFGALAAHGYFDFHKTGLEPLKFAGNYLIDGNNPLYFGIPLAITFIGSLGYIAKTSKTKKQQNFSHPAPAEANNAVAVNSSVSSCVANTRPDLNAVLPTLQTKNYTIIPCYNFPSDYNAIGLSPEKIAQRRIRYSECECTYGLKLNEVRYLEYNDGSFNYILVKWFDVSNQLDAYHALGYGKEQLPELMTMLNSHGFGQMTYNSSPTNPPDSLISSIER